MKRTTVNYEFIEMHKWAWKALNLTNFELPTDRRKVRVVDLTRTK